MSRIVMVNENDEVIGSAATAEEAIANRALRRIVRVFLFNEKGELLIQKRSQLVRRPNEWDHSVGGHVDEGEDYSVAAYREVAEELGITVLNLNIVTLSVKENTVFSGIFAGVIDSKTPINIDPKEVAEVKWIAVTDLEHLLEHKNEPCTDGLMVIWPRFKKEIIEGKDHKRITVVNEKDEVIGYENFFHAIEKCSIRQGSCIFIVDEQGRHLIQKRSKYISKPLKLDKAVGGHVDEGDNYESTAHKEAQEELGLTGLTLELVAHSHRTAEFFESVYKAVIPSDTPINFDPHEVDSVYWMTTEEVDSLTNTNPGIFTKNFIELWNTFHDKIVAS